MTISTQIVTLLEAESYDKLIRLLKREIKKAPSNYQLTHLLAGVYHLQKKLPKALKIYEELKRKKQLTTPQSVLNLSLCYLETNAFNKARYWLNRYEKLYGTDLTSINSRLSLAINQKNKKQISQLQELLKTLCKQNQSVENSPDLLINLFLSSYFLKRYKEAVSYAQKLDPSYYDRQMWSHLAKSMQKLAFFENEKIVLEKAMSYLKDDLHLSLQYMKLLSDSGEYKSLKTFLKTLDKNRYADVFKLKRDVLIPCYFETEKAITDFRRDFLKKLESLSIKKWKNPYHYLRLLGDLYFYLCYQGKNEVEMMSALSSVFKTILPKSYSLKKQKKKKQDHRIRVGIISSHVYKQSVSDFYEYFYKSFPKDFYVVAFVKNVSKDDDVTRRVRSSIDQYYTIDTKWEEAKDKIAAEKLDILIYPELGMVSDLYYLSYTRLAPIQCVLMGHPQTTGVPTMDYFLSSEIYEMETAQSHYTETLIPIKGFPICYKKHKVDPSLFPIESLKLPLKSDDSVYFCPMVSFKIHPSFDEVVYQLLKRNPKAQIMFIHSSLLSEKIKKRLHKKCQELSKRVHFIRALSFPNYLSLLSNCTAILETFPFGGGNTTLQVLNAGTPVVTLETEFLRGRFTQGYYRYMGVTDCIAQTREEYIDIAVKLGLDSQFNQEMRSQIKNKRSVLFNNKSGVEKTYQVLRDLCQNHGLIRPKN